MPWYLGFRHRDVHAAIRHVDVHQSSALHPGDRTKILDRIGGLDGRGLRELNQQVGETGIQSKRIAGNGLM